MIKKKTVVLSTLLIGSSLVIGTTAFADKATTGTVDYTAGTLSLDGSAVLPDNLNFGNHPIQSKVDETWVATGDGVQTSTATTGAINVSDNRGTSAGWSVKVNQAAQFARGSDTLTAAALSITGGAVTNNLSVTPTGEGFGGKKVTLDINTTANVLSAKVTEGNGETSLPLTKFELAVPKTTVKKGLNYQTTLNWTLSATP